MGLPPADLATSYLLVGVPSPQLLQRLLSVSVGGYRPPVDIIETDTQTFLAWLHLLDHSGLRIDGRVHVFAGDEAVDDYRRFIINTPGRVPASLILTNHRPGWHSPRVDGAMMTAIGNEVRQRQIRQRSNLDQRLRSRHAAYWRGRFGTAGRTSAPLRVVGFTNRYSTVIQHAMRDLAAIAVDGETARAVSHGATFAARTLLGDRTDAGPFAVCDERGDLLAVYERRGAGLKPAVVLATEAVA